MRADPVVRQLVNKLCQRLSVSGRNTFRSFAVPNVVDRRVAVPHSILWSAALCVLQSPNPVGRHVTHSAYNDSDFGTSIVQRP